MATKKKKIQKSKFKFNRKLAMYLILTVALLMGAFYLYQNAFSADSVSGSKCTETPRLIKDYQSIKLTFIDSKTKAGISANDFVSGKGLKIGVSARKCQGPGEKSSGSSGGCSAYNESFSSQTDLKTGDEVKIALYALDRKCGSKVTSKYYVGGKNGAYRLFFKSISIKTSNNKLVGTLKSPSGSSIKLPLPVKTESAAVDYFNKTLNQVVTYNSKIVSSAESTSSATASSTTSSSGDKYKIIVKSDNIAVGYGDSNISKGCSIVVGYVVSGSANKYRQTGCNGRGEYPTITFSGVPSNTDHLGFLTTDQGGFLSLGVKRDVITVPFETLKNLGSSYKNLGSIGSNDRQLKCKKDDLTITCVYAPIMREIDNKEKVDFTW